MLRPSAKPVEISSLLLSCHTSNQLQLRSRLRQHDWQQSNVKQYQALPVRCGLLATSVAKSLPRSRLLIYLLYRAARVSPVALLLQGCQG